MESWKKTSVKWEHPSVFRNCHYHVHNFHAPLFWSRSEREREGYTSRRLFLHRFLSYADTRCMLFLYVFVSTQESVQHFPFKYWCNWCNVSYSSSSRGTRSLSAQQGQHLANIWAIGHWGYMGLPMCTSVVHRGEHGLLSRGSLGEIFGLSEKQRQVCAVEIGLPWFDCADKSLERHMR